MTHVPKPKRQSVLWAVLGVALVVILLVAGASIWSISRIVSQKEEDARPASDARFIVQYAPNDSGDYLSLSVVTRTTHGVAHVTATHLTGRSSPPTLNWTIPNGGEAPWAFAEARGLYVLTSTFEEPSPPAPITRWVYLGLAHVAIADSPSGLALQLGSNEVNAP